MAVTLPTSTLGNESQMGLDKQLLYEKRLAELESHIQALLTWKQAILATLEAVNRPTSPVISRRKTVDVVPPELKSLVGVVHIPTEATVPENKESVPTVPSNNTIDAQPGEVTSQASVIHVSPQLRAPHDIAHRILDVLQAYGRHIESDEGKHEWLGREKFFPRVAQYVNSQQPIRMILPSFPWKSINRVDKVTSALPDLGEELALARLNSLCVDIGKVYKHGAEIHIATDGLVFNDLVGISDDDTWEYSVALMEMAAKKSFTGIKLLRVMDFLGYTKGKSPLTKEQYLSLVDKSRAELETQFGNPDKDIREMIQTDKDTLMTYRGFIRFLETDLRYSPVAAHSRSGNHYRRVVKEVAMRMMMRAESFTKIIQAKCPDYVRLSIHPSSGSVKLSVPLLIEKNNPKGFPRTPWHSSIAVGLDGSYRSMHSKDVRETHDLVMKDGNPWCFREKSDLFDLGSDVEIEHLYPSGLEVRPLATQTGYAHLGQAVVEKLAKLARMQPVKLVGFVDVPQFLNRELWC
ncbi:Pyoverdine/dityrosine biosynthesis protein-domain-containing protein [Thelonectria olida]|uniref:Pyoverdine/dityrosine biosynthesis protein-domain-containing protein n=1 Tax=Thelonectria olida TaxID=1576542 RepID=A0A9P8VUF8_9HYPO|nr:Pyoverdine/dityrosine biosynthesis protein-domain-containing protein [Thelonectria olida]